MENTYIVILHWIRSSNTRELVIRKLCKYLPYVSALTYIGIIIYTLLYTSDTLLGILVTPFLSFIIVTIIRKIWNRPRPYESLSIPSLFHKKTGESCPSRHTASAFSIAIAGYTILPILGYFLFFIATLIALSRFVAGVHYPSDILLAIFLTLLIQYLVSITY